MKKGVETHLVPKKSKFPTVCTFCNKKIDAETMHYLEQGVKNHLHSLIARKFCSACYAKYGETVLLRGKD